MINQLFFIAVVIVLYVKSESTMPNIKNNSSLSSLNNTNIMNTMSYDLWNQMLNDINITIDTNNEEQWICNTDTCPNSRGSCNQGKCICLPSYTYANRTDYGCNYQRKQQLTFLICETLLSLGIGHFLIGNTITALFKIILGFTPCLFGILSACSVLPIKHYEHIFGPCTAIIILLCALTFMLWWLLDIIFILGTSIYDCDGSGIGLAFLFTKNYHCPNETYV